MQLIMAATDGSEGSNRAVDMAATLAKETGAKLLIVTVGDGFSEDDIDMDQLARAEGGVGEAIELVAGSILQRASERAHRRGALVVEVAFAWGDAAAVILETAHQRNAEIVAVGRRGRGRIAGLLLGSVSQKLASLASSAVLVVP